MDFLTNILADKSIFNERQFWIVVSGEDGEWGMGCGVWGVGCRVWGVGNG